MIAFIKKLLKNETIRYIVGGGCTTLVNFVVFFTLRFASPLPRNACNVIAILFAIMFAYFINKLFVFQSKTKSFSAAVSEAISFFAARMFAMAIEVIGFALLCDTFRLNELASKFIVQFFVVGTSYILSKLVVFKKERKSIPEIVQENYCYFVSFLTVFLFMLIMCIAEEVVPFGGRSLTIVDSLHQYLPFFSDYRDKLLNEGSLFYSWNIAMGQNFMSLSAYYLASPFNLILLLFSKENLIIGVNLILILRIALCAFTMAYYLAHKDKRKDEKPEQNVAIIALSVAYALSNFMLGYGWNVMWLDCIMIMPIILLGVQRLIEERDGKLYALSLFFCLYSNYYIGFIICIFLVLWFLFYPHKGFKRFFFSGVRFAVYSLVGGAMAAFSLIPAFMGIRQTASANAKLPQSQWYGNIFEMFKQQLFFTEPITNQTFDGGVNLYCGMFAVLAMFLYIFCRKISLQKKLSRIALLGILMVSFNNEALNFIWHGFHNQYGIPNRFSFLFIFVLLVMAYEIILTYKEEDLLQVLGLFLAACLSVVFVFACQKYTSDVIPEKTIKISILLLMLYFLVLILHSLNILKKSVFVYGISIMMFVEVFVNASLGMLSVGTANYEGNYDTAMDVTNAYQEVKKANEENGNQFYRAELMDHKVLDEATWHNMPSVGTFCSTVGGEVVTTMGRLGFYTGANEFLYMGCTPLTNSIFNVQYLLKREGELDNFKYNYVATKHGVEIYENPYPLAIGFAVSEEVKEWDRDAYLPFDNQNILLRKMIGAANIFSYSSVPYLCTGLNCEVYSEGSKVYYTPTQTNDVGFIAAFYVDHAGDYYINCRGDYVKDITFSINGEEYASDRYQIQIFHLGQLQKGDYVTVEYNFNTVQLEERNVSIYLAAFDEFAYRDGYERLSDQLLHVTEYDDGYVKGTISVNEGETLFTSIPYDTGWKLKVDGKKAEYYSVCGAFIGIDLEPGVHEIELTYTPNGLWLGILVSIIGLEILLIAISVEKKLAKKHNRKCENETEERS